MYYQEALFEFKSGNPVICLNTFHTRLLNGLPVEYEDFVDLAFSTCW